MVRFQEGKKKQEVKKKEREREGERRHDEKIKYIWICPFEKNRPDEGETEPWSEKVHPPSVVVRMTVIAS